MNYNQIELFLHDNIEPKGSVLGLDVVRALLDRLGTPENDLKFIHITGTNGKGSVGAILESVLMAAGYSVGRFTSPAVLDKFETITYNRKNITKKFYVEGYSRIIEEYKAMEEDGENTPTVFETEFALALLYFKSKIPDFCLIEVGMGGDMDATNVIPKKEEAIITHISLEHQAFLGKTLEEIATHKAGIIKEGASVITAPQEKEVLDVIKQKAKECETPLYEANEEDIKKASSTVKGWTFGYKDIKKIFVPMAGEYQKSNIVTALKAIEGLRDKGYEISDEQIVKGFKETYWPCRFETVSRKPLIIMDGAHNVDAASKLMQSVQNYDLSGKLIYIVGILKDKNYEEMVKLSYPHAMAVITITPPENPRALDGYKLAEEYNKYIANVTAADSLEDAIFLARAMAGKDGNILIWGSLSYLGKMREILKMNK